jgi:gentisate 1,2-dioxygenase
MTTTRFDGGGDRDLDALYGDLAAEDLQPLWTQQGLMPAHPPRQVVPHLWSGKRLRALAERAGEVVPIDRGGDRRVLALANPGLGGLPYATSTLWGAVQYLGVGEVAPSHRHTPAALRFVLEGSGVWTLVDGDPVAMSPGDLVLTPSWAWHEHHNPGDSPMIWFDGLDLPLVQLLDAIFFEPGPDQMTNRAVDPVSRSEHLFGQAAGVLPEPALPAGRHSPLLAYRWAGTDAALGRLVDQHGGSASVRFTDPVTGADAMPTLRCSMHRLTPSGRSPSTRRIGSSIWVAFRGSCTAVIGGRRFPVEAGDMFVVPSWTPFDLEAHEVTDLFCVSDAPVIEALRLDRSETLADHQQSI